MKKKIFLVILILILSACDSSNSSNINGSNIIKVKKINESDLKIIRLNNVSTYFQGIFENIDLKDRVVNINVVQYLNNKKIKSIPLISTSANEKNVTTFDFDFSILNVVDNEVILNTMYNNIAIGREILTFSAISDSYDYGVLTDDVNLENNNTIYLGYYGINKTDYMPENIKDIKIQNYSEIIVIELTIE